MAFKTVTTLKGISSFVIDNSTGGKFILPKQYKGITAENLFPLVTHLQVERYPRGYELLYPITETSNSVIVDTTTSKMYFDKVVEDIDIQPVGVATMYVESYDSVSQSSYDISMIVINTSFLGGALSSVKFEVRNYSNNELLASYDHRNQSVTTLSDLRLFITKTGVKRVKIKFICTNTSGTVTNNIALRPTRGNYLSMEICSVTYKTFTDFNSKSVPYSVNFLCMR